MFSRRLQRRSTATASSTLIGGYGPWADTTAGVASAMDDVSTQMGRTINHGHFFFDHRWGWDPIEGDATLLNAWSNWIDLDAGSRSVSISVPLLPGSSDGGDTVLPEKGDFAGLARGDYDHHFAILGAQLAARPQFTNVILRLGWEFNGYGWPWSPTQDTTSGSLAQAVINWRIGFARAASAIKSNCPSAQVVWCPSLGYDALPSYNFSHLFPEPSVVDLVGLGAYDYNLNVTSYPQTTAGFLQRWNDNWIKPNGYADLIAFAELHSKPLVHMEWGLWPVNYLSQQGGDDPVYIDKVFDFFRDYNVVLSVYNNSTPEHALASYPAAHAAYRARVQNDFLR